MSAQGFASLFVTFILLHTTRYVANGRVIEQYKFTVNEYCKQCTPGRLNSQHIPYNEMLTYLTELSAINTAEICRFYNEIFGKDVDSFSHTDIPVDFHIHHNLSHQASDFTKTYEKLIDIALYYQLGRLETFNGVEIVEGVSLPDISASIVPILCGLRRATHDTQKSQLKKVCKKSITLPIESKPANSAIFAKWLFSILQFSRTEYCHIFNEISGVQLSCNNLSNVADLC